MNEYLYINLEEISALRRWHILLESNRGDRARLRRAGRSEDILLSEAFFNFQKIMPEIWLKNKSIIASAAVAGLLSHVKKDHQVLSRIQSSQKTARLASFAEQLAVSEKSNKALMSELRFQQLQKSRTTDDFYRHVVRATHLLDGRVNIVSLANDIIHWHLEFDRRIDREPGKRLAVRWATDYFSAILLNQK
jgi:CRISPR system Cascade subunit CasB